MSHLLNSDDNIFKGQNVEFNDINVNRFFFHFQFIFAFVIERISYYTSILLKPISS
jgi:hypothetical protein